MKRSTRYLLLAALVLLLFLVFTLCVTQVDVRPIGPEGSEVGFADFNLAVLQSIGTSALWETAAKLLGYLAILAAAVFAAAGVWQLIRRKRLLRVDPELLALGGMLLLVAIAYAVFEVLVINYRPVLENGELAASYPSSHTMLAITVFGGIAFSGRTYFSGRRFRCLFIALCILLALVTTAARLLSGVHWATDILGSLLLSGSLLLFQRVLAAALAERRRSKTR